MNLTTKQWVAIVAGVLAIVVLVAFFTGLMERNDTQNWQLVQSLGGNVYVRSQAGYYAKYFGKVWTYPRAVQCYFSGKGDEGGAADQSIRVTFNDGGTAQISAMAFYRTPVTEEYQLKMHQNFNNDMDSVTHTVRAHLTNCIKATGPLMSSSEHQSARKAEFTQLVETQLRNGLYVMRKIDVELKDRTDEDGNPITVYATEIVEDADGVPKIAQTSPLKEYNIEILQFSVTETLYDTQTLAQFATKKEAFLAAEQSKAEREQEVQQRLMIIEKGLREAAEAEAVANVRKTTSVIAAQEKFEIAEQAKLEAETKASMALAVAVIEKEEAETKANMELAVAELNAQAAIQKGAAVVTLAEAEEKRIEIAGAITEKDQILAEIEANMRAKIAENLAKIQTPATLVVGGSGAEGGGNDLMSNMVNLLLMRHAGIIGEDGQPAPLAPRK
jgi:hypothetical protein